MLIKIIILRRIATKVAKGYSDMGALHTIISSIRFTNKLLNPGKILYYEREQGLCFDGIYILMGKDRQ